MLHHVLTLENSITQGGHMFMRDAMHLTEWTRILSHVCQRAGTNDLHPGIQRTLGRMMIATSLLGPTEGKSYHYPHSNYFITHFEQYPRSLSWL